ncbi:MAG: class I SAM-dependent methyltransferase [Kiloniellales bacterium]
MLEPEHRADPDGGASGKFAIVHRACPLCAHDNAAGPAGRYSHETWEVKDCARCGFVYIEKAPEYEALFSEMAWERTTKIEERRRAEIRPFSYGFSKKTRARMRILPRKKMHLLVEAHARPGNVIDLGCGDGMVMAKLSGDFVPFGVEISRHLAASAKRVFGARGGRAINAPSLEGLTEFPDAFFCAASLRSYLEHEMKPLPVLRELHRTLAPGGVAIVKVPNYGSLNRMVMGRKWCGFRYPDHLNYFTPGTLRAMAERCGYRVWFGWTFRLPTSDNMYAVLTKAEADRG